MAWTLDSDKPLYTQLMEIIQMRIISGYYQSGERLPSVRELAAEASVNPNTMQKALVELERSGLIITQRTSGRIITEDKELIHQTRKQLAEGHIQYFLQHMEELGFSRKEILSHIQTFTEGDG
ncbi:MAG: GntR family transcriptional regulator [Lachnospiraceae bacterium]|nr:GntR family transcriptional regulator [Lachnospiraceae bacterium]